MKKIVKVLALILAASLVFSLAACKETEKAEIIPAGTKPIPRDQIKVGVVHITSIEDKSGYTFAHHSGIMKMKEDLGLKDSQIIEKDNIDDNDKPATKTAIQELIDEGCDVIFATSFNYMDTMNEFASNPDYKNIVFSHCSGFMSNDENFNNYFGRIYEARYLSGIVAGLKAKELGVPKLGYVAAQDVDNSEVTGGINAWALGIQSVYPEATVYVKVTGSWFDPKAETEAAQALYDHGCVVLGQHSDSDATQTTAEKNGIFGCGYNSDMTDAAPKAHLCAPIWNWGEYYTTAVASVIDGKWAPPVNYYEGMKVDFVDISPLNPATVTADAQAAVDKAKAEIKSDELIVFKAPIIDNKGNEIVGENEDGSLSDGQITGGINYYIKGVELL